MDVFDKESCCYWLGMMCELEVMASVYVGVD